ncbi:MAG: hydrolase [Chlamydiales bacterium]
MEWLSKQFEQMVSLVERWSNINSFSYNREGLDRMFEEVDKVFSSSLFPEEKKTLDLPNGKALFLKKRKQAPFQVLFGGHFDTVFSPEHPFQKVTYIDDNTLQGPGVCDMKGGLVVMLKVLEALEQSGNSQIGWEILLNPDEEIGSPYSSPLFESAAKRCDLALIFEPTLENGSFVSARKGSSIFLVESKGKAAHAGREPQKGINAIYPLARFISEVESFHSVENGDIVNVGIIQGGSRVNIVPEHAQCALMIRSWKPTPLEQKVIKSAHKMGLEIHRKGHRPAKPLDTKTEALFKALQKCGQQLGLTLKWEKSGGVCDGNITAHAGTPTLDSLGVRGANIHTDEEIIHLNSLVEKAQLIYLFLNELAQGNIPLQRRKK